MIANTPEYASDATTLGESTEQLEHDGFTSQFGAADDGEVMCFTCRKRTPASQIPVEALRRTEGASDPDDMVLVAAVTCPQCGAKGTLVLKYGAESSFEEAEVLLDLTDGRTSQSGGQSTSENPVA